GTCFAFTGNGLTPGDGSNTGSCSNFESPHHCYVAGTGGVVDDMDALDNLCSAADSGGHLQGIAAEEIVYLKGTPEPSPSPSPANTQTIVYMINTMSHLVNYTSGGCENTVAIDIESSGGSFPGLSGYLPGSVAAGVPIREEATALRFLVPDPKTLVPDRMQPFYFTIGGSANSNCSVTPGCEIPYFFEETMVPQGPEVTVNAFTYGGASSPGDGCPTPGTADSGGAVDLKVDCISGDNAGAAVFKQQYLHLYINGLDYGPAAVLLNTASATSVIISSSWFGCSGCDPLSDYNRKVALSGGELQSVQYGSGSIALPLCNSTTYCNGDNTVPGNTATFNPSSPSSIGPHSGLILLKSRSVAMSSNGFSFKSATPPNFQVVVACGLRLRSLTERPRPLPVHTPVCERKPSLAGPSWALDKLIALEASAK
ncbi:MAG: hypothetical protein WAK16_13925, partial [Candidatus Cybelea sp.]